MWHKLQKQVETELEQLRRLLETHRSLLKHSSHSTPSAIELSAMASMLHSYYNGVENVLKRIAIEIDGAVLSGEFWHRDLLDTAMRPSPSRPAAISEELGERLGEYLAFRHYFRHAYTFDLQWDRMQALVLDCEPTLQRFHAEIWAFLQGGPGGKN